MTNNNKPCTIIIEGVDCSGKSTLLKELNKVTNYRHTIIDRGHLSTIVYANKYNRDYDDSEYLLQLTLMSETTNLVIIYCKCDIPTIVGRVISTDEKDYKATDIMSLRQEIQQDIDSFDKYINIISNYVKVIQVDTSLALDEIVNSIVDNEL